MVKFQILTTLGIVFLGMSSSNLAVGNQFDNIVHYSCFQKRVLNYPNRSGNREIAPPDYSARSNYENLYIRSTHQGEINLFNQDYECPEVSEGLEGNGSFWPLDSNFALSTESTPEFNVAVEARTRLAVGGDEEENRNCSGSTSKDPSTPFLNECLGFAAQPNPDGSCPSMKGSTGKIVNLYRLRRFFSLNPPQFNANSTSMEAQNVDSVYVLDRPVQTRSGLNSTMLGPKPCPAAYFDRNSSFQEPPAYLGYFPRFEEDTSFQACAPQSSHFRDPPLHFSKNPVTGNVAWCAESYPTQNTHIEALDPPLTARQGEQSVTIPSGSISNYTSHTVRNTASGACHATSISIPTSGYDYDLAPGSQKYALHASSTLLPWEGNLTTANQTCDRTIVSLAVDWPLFPLLAPSQDLEAAIIQDSSYECSLTQTGATPIRRTPSGGCCDQGSVFLRSGVGGEQSAHLEPDTPCRVPID